MSDKVFKPEDIVNALTNANVIDAFKRVLGDVKETTSQPARAMASLAMSNLYDQKMEARTRQRKMANVYQSGLQSQMGAGTASGGMNYLAMLGGSAFGSDFMLSTPYSTQRLNRELAAVEVRRRGSEMVGQSAYEALNVYSLGLSGMIGRRTGVESAIYNAAENERGMERMSRGLTLSQTGSKTSAAGFGFRAGTMRDSARILSINEGALQRDFGYSSKQLQQSRESAMSTLDASTVSDLFNEGGNTKIAETVSKLQERFLKYGRELNTGMKDIEGFFQQLSSFGARVDKESEQALSAIRKARVGVGNVSAAEYMAFTSESRGTAKQQYMGGFAYSQANLQRMQGIARSTKGGPIAGSVYRSVLGRYGGDTAQGYANLTRTVAEGGYGYMESGLGMMTRMAMIQNKGQGPLNGGLMNLMGQAGQGIGANPLLALQAQVNEDVRGAVASNGLDYAMKIAEQNPIMKMAKTEKQRNVLKAKLMSSFTGRSLNEMYDIVNIKTAENKALKNAHQMSGLKISEAEYGSKVRAYATRGNMSIEEAANNVNKKMNGKTEKFDEVVSSDEDFNRTMDAGMAAEAESSSLIATTTDGQVTVDDDRSWWSRNVQKASRYVGDAISDTYYATQSAVAMGVSKTYDYIGYKGAAKQLSRYAHTQEATGARNNIARNAEQRARAKADRFRTFDAAFGKGKYKAFSDSIKSTMAEGFGKGADADDFNIQQILNVDETKYNGALGKLAQQWGVAGVDDGAIDDAKLLIKAYKLNGKRVELADSLGTDTMKSVAKLFGKSGKELDSMKDQELKAFLDKQGESVIRRTLSKVVKTAAETKGFTTTNPLYVVARTGKEWPDGITGATT